MNTWKGFDKSVILFFSQLFN